MTEIEIPLPANVSKGNVIRVVEAACAATGLRVTLKDSLRRYPGSIHWHYKRGQEAGTLEITFWPNASRLWCKIAANRASEWIAPTITQLRTTISHALFA